MPEPGAELYVGLKRGVSRAEFEEKIADGTVADCFHRGPVRAGDTMFLPSGRVHAIGFGLVILRSSKIRTRLIACSIGIASG